MQSNYKEDLCKRGVSYWVEVDAENGGTLGASEKYDELSVSNRCADLYRASFWLRKLEETSTDKYVWHEEMLRLNKALSKNKC